MSSHPDADGTAPGDGAPCEGTVVVRSSREVTVRMDAAAGDWICELRGVLRRDGRGALVVGDRVLVEPVAPGRGRIKTIRPRRSQLARRRETGGVRELVLAANIDRVVAFFAARQPRLKFGALDRLLVAAESNALPVTIVLNKVDLAAGAELQERLATYPSLGYPVLPTSGVTGEGLDALRALLIDQVTVVAGPSGVGKSTLIGAVLGIDLKVAEVSHANEKGRHTTTVATWFSLPGGGAVVDTPGFRDFGLGFIDPSELGYLFPEFRPLLGGCRFRDCLHRDEPGCAIHAAAEAGTLDPWRLRSYLGMLPTLPRG